MKKIIISLAFLTIICVAATVMTEPRDKEKIGPCRDDREKFCKDVKPGQGRIIKCLNEHESELSATCKEHLAMMKEKMAEFKKACGDDSKKYCKKNRPGKGRIIRCLKEHETELSDPCKEFIQNK
jgi:hypothetical protein